MRARVSLPARLLLGLSLPWVALGCEKSRLNASLQEYRHLTTASLPGERRVIELARFVERRPELKTNPQLTEACAAIGRYRARAGEIALAAAWFERALAARPDDPTLLNLAGYHYARHGVALSRAAAMLSRAVDIGMQRGYPPRQIAFFKDSLGWALRGQGELERAISLLEEARDLAPDVAIIDEHLQQAHRDLAEREERTGGGSSPVAGSGASDRRELDVGLELQPVIEDGEASDVKPGADGTGVEPP